MVYCHSHPVFYNAEDILKAETSVKKFLSLALTLVPAAGLFPLLPMTALAETVAVENNWGGGGEVFTIEDGVLVDYLLHGVGNGFSGHVDIPNIVTRTGGGISGPFAPSGQWITV